MKVNRTSLKMISSITQETRMGIFTLVLVMTLKLALRQCFVLRV